MCVGVSWIPLGWRQEGLRGCWKYAGIWDCSLKQRETEGLGTRGFREDLEGQGTGFWRMLDFEVGASSKEAKELGYFMGAGVGGRIFGDSERTEVSRNPGSLGFRVSQVTGASKAVKKRELSLHPRSTLGGRRTLQFRIVRKLDSG